VRSTALAALAVAAALAAGAEAGSSATVRFASLTPVVKVRGAHFVPSERIQVTVYAGSAKLARLVRASSTGAFTAGLGSIADKDRCGASISVVAAGPRGDRAVYKLPRLDCPNAQPDQTTSSGK
jgi:hypothetical protein